MRAACYLSSLRSDLAAVLFVCSVAVTIVLFLNLAVCPVVVKALVAKQTSVVVKTTLVVVETTSVVVETYSAVVKMTPEVV